MGLPVFYCDLCGKWVHSSCLLSGSPSPVLFDNYFYFKCVSCSEDGKESFTRMKLTWNQVASLALYNVSQSSPGKDGFHKWKEVVVEFIDKHWDLLFGSHKKKTNTWVNTIAATLSAGNPHQFTSGYGFFKESGWWKLTDMIPPEYDPHSTVASRAKEMRLRKPKISGILTPTSTTCRLDGLRKRSLATPSASQFKEQKINGQAENIDENDKPDEENSPPSFKGCRSPASSTPSSPFLHVDMMTSRQDFSGSPTLGLRALSDVSDEEQEVPHSAFSPVKRRSIKLKASRSEEDEKPGLKEMSLYEECSLLKKLESFGSRLRKVPAAYRLRRKLLVRQRKRELNIPIIGFDQLVQNLVSNGTVLPKHLTNEKYCRFAMDTSGQLRILDRFQVGFAVNARRSTSNRTFRQKLVGCDDDDVPPAVVSPYTQRILQSFIRRDYESFPLKLRLLREIRSHKKSSAEDSTVRKSPIDFCYVRECHISSINSMCHHFFWPEIDVTESLQYPDFSVVALYRKMVIGFGFMVPDVSFNEAYITFLFVHPDWRCAGIGTFMLYHLIQTCMGKDVTLHVSASNPAMLVYQKFGFKPEAFVADFYEKYYKPDSKECKHAFFMRLRR